jgi:hypothetical protein
LCFALLRWLRVLSKVNQLGTVLMDGAGVGLAPFIAMSIFERQVDSPYSRVSCINPECVVIVGGGPSVTQCDVDYCADRAFVIAVNSSYLLAPCAEVVYFCDSRFYMWHKKRAEFQQIRGELATLENVRSVTDLRVHHLRQGLGKGLATETDTLNHGSNSGYQCINLAAHLGARLIVLLGFDMRTVDGATHWHGGHPQGASAQVYEVMLRKFPSLVAPLVARRIQVINATPNSALKVFPTADLREVV